MSEVTSYLYAGTMSQETTLSGAIWRNTDNAKAQDSAYAGCAVASETKDGAVSCNPLIWTNFNFGSVIPSYDVAIRGVEVTLGRHASAAEMIGDRTMYLRFNGFIVSRNMYSTPTWPTTPADKVYGDPTNVWGGNITKEMVVNSTFGASLQIAGNGTAYVNYLKMRIYYSPLPIAITNESGWRNVWDAKVAHSRQMQPITTGWVVVNGVWQKWWPPPKS